MDYKEHIQRAIDFIEDNLQSDMKLTDVASASGYSLYHFLRIFKEATKLTPADYIRKRRITEITKLMAGNDHSIADLAFKYGFNSKENFLRAFKAEHHILPTEYKAAQNSLKLYESISFAATAFSIMPEIKELGAFSLTVYPSDEAYPPNFWNKYNCRKLSVKLTGGRICEDYGISIFDGKLYYYIGVLTENAKGDTAGTVVLDVPKGLYAVFETPEASPYNFVHTIHRTWEYIGSCWLPNSGYQRRKAPEFETYTESDRNFREKIYIPVQ